MRCGQVQALIGVYDELDTPSRRALQNHFGACPACAAAWRDEAILRRLLADRPAPPSSAGFEARLIAIPARRWPWRARHPRAARLGGPAAIVLAVAGAGLWLAAVGSGRLAVDAPPAGVAEMGSTVAERGSGALPSGPSVGDDHAASAILRAGLPPLPRGDRGRGPDPSEHRTTRSGSPDTGSDDDRGDGSARTAAGRAAAVAAVDVGAAAGPGRPPAAVPAPPATTPAQEGARLPDERSGPAAPRDRQREPKTPTDVPTLSTLPTPAPPTATAPSAPATPAIPAVRLALRIEAGEPDLDLADRQAAVQVDAEVDGQWVPVYEEVLTFAGSVATDRPEIASPPPYAVALLGNPPGVELCAGEARRRVLGTGDIVGRQATVVFRVCAMRPPATPEETAGATAEATAATTVPPAASDRSWATAATAR